MSKPLTLVISLGERRCVRDALRRLVVLAFVFLPLVGGYDLTVAHAQGGNIVAQLIELARGWQAKGRTDKAIEVWKKVLLSQPENAEALEAVGLWHANAGRRSEASAMLATLERVAPGGNGVTRLRAALRLGTGFNAQVQEARAKAHAGDLAQAAILYEQAFGGPNPPENLALEYYQTLGGTDAGWDRARVGLEAFAKSHPDRADARLALAQHLTYREGTRRAGIDMLRELAKDPATHAVAAAAWLKALLWMRAGPSDAARLSAYLNEIGEQAEVSARLKNLSLPAAIAQQGNSVREGYEALGRNDTAAASREFERARSAPEALVGLALIAMRKEDFDLAVTLLEKASHNAPNSTDLWRQPLASARFWQSIRQAEKMAAAKDYVAAESKLREAIELSPDEGFNARLALANLLRKRDALEAAEHELTVGLSTQPDQPMLLRALVDLRIERDEFEGAIEANTHLATVAEAKAYPAAELNGEILRRRAKKLRDNGAQADALLMLQEAIKQAPKSYWVQYDLAALQLEMGDLGAARETVQGLFAIDSKEPSGRVLRARISAEAGKPSLALQVLEGLPAEAADGQVGKLRTALELRRDVDQVVRSSARLGVFGAQREMLRLQRRIGGDPELVGIVALGWADIGVADRGISLIRDLQRSRSELDPGTSLLLAAIYLRAGMDKELKQLLEELASEPSLPPRARHDLARLHVAFAVASADRLATHGEYTRALLLLEPLITEYPYDPALMSGLGRLLLQEGKPTAASSAFEQVLRQDPDHVEAREGAVAAAEAVYDMTKAGELVKQGLERSPNHPRMHLIAAHYALAQGDDATAMRELSSARDLAVKGEPPDRAGDEGDARLVPSDAAGLLARARTPVGGGEALQAAESKALIDTIDGEIDRIRARHSVQVWSEPEVRYRRGEQGLGQLIESRTPLWLSMPLGYFGRLEIGATAVWLTAGRARLDNPDAASRFGSLGAVPGITAPRMQDDIGVAPELALLYKDLLRLEFGTTPLGFIYRDLVGSLQVRPRWGLLSLTLRIDRSPVEDSVLSYAGTTDPVTGRTWGGVIQQGGFAEIGLGRKELSGFLNGGFYLIDGRGMEKNRTGRAMTGFTWTLYDWDGHKISWGGTLLGMKYAKNQSDFTLGHGGYFSPELFARGGTPLTWSYLNEHLQTRLEVDPGLNWFRQASAPYYPNDPDLQANLEALGGVASYPEHSSFGFSMNVAADARWQLGNFGLGLSASMHFADDYEEYRAGLFLQLNLQRRVQADPDETVRN